MANFRVHVLGAAIPSALAAGLALAGGLVTPAVAGACFGLGVLGGMLPDIDAESSVPTRILFGALAVAAAVVVGLALRERLAPALVVLAALGAFVAIRVGLRGFLLREPALILCSTARLRALLGRPAAWMRSSAPWQKRTVGKGQAFFLALATTYRLACVTHRDSGVLCGPKVVAHALSS